MERWGLLGNCWRKLGSICMVSALIIGCRTPPPNLRPPNPPEELNKPPMEARYTDKEWPAIVLDGYENKKPNDPTAPPGTRGNGMGNNMGGPGGMQQAGGTR